MTVKVLHVFGTMNRGGAEIRTVSLMRDLAQKGVVFDYCALSGNRGVLDDEIKALGGNVFYCKLDLKFVFRFILLARHYDVVHSHVAYVSGFIILLAKIARVKIRIAHFRNTTDGVKRSFFRRFRNSLLGFLINICSTHILGVCRGALAGFMGSNWEQNSKCQVVYNGFELISPERKPDIWKDYIPNFEHQKIIINVGRVDRQKNHIRQLEIFNALHQLDKECHLVLIGKENAKLKETLRTFIENHNLNDFVHFLGLQSDVPSLLVNADVMLFPSLWEGLPGAVIEALSLGVPVVASHLPGVLEIAESVDGIVSLSLSENNQRWAQEIVELLNHRPAKDQLIESFKNSPFLLKQNVEQLHIVYTS
ncbi:glycosyltransferase [Paraglaciecola arctica]|uniref:glycosyltransferase n=1 Tax=Paraglaciecola arctica TaxID=1128911 RepID=UPI001C07DAC4|nr:glycosyltransferase [Paraglaciecola arctica]MBU3002437.1 glycosyltransferase [Paraglaciecola arctica]